MKEAPGVPDGMMVRCMRTKQELRAQISLPPARRANADKSRAAAALKLGSDT
jgi:hypothetical protein